MVEYNAWDIFKVDEAQDCDSVKRVLKQVNDARGHMFDGDGPAQLQAIKNVLEGRLADLGCLD